MLSIPSAAQKFSMEQVAGYPFPSELAAASTGSRIAVAINERGQRNIYVAEAPSFELRKLTAYNEDEGQEITSLQLSADGKKIVYVRGGDHGSSQGSIPRNVAGRPIPARVQVYQVPFDGGSPELIDDGDYPAIDPAGRFVAYIKGDQVWVSPLAGKAKPERMFYSRGRVTAFEWSPDGSSVAFVTNRATHSFIGIFRDSSNPVQYLAPDFARDQSPKWTPDGKKIVFARTAARGGKPDSLTSRQPAPWTLCIADLSSGNMKVLWKSPNTLRGSSPDTHGRYNINTAPNGRVLYMSYQDGWPHLYAIDTSGGQPVQLSKGSFMLEHIRLAADGSYALASANTGPDRDDLHRRHLVKLAIDKPGMEVLTPGSGIEAFPVSTGDGNSIAYISATAQQPGVFTVMNITSRQIIKPGEKLVPADFPSKSLVTPKAVQFKASDGTMVYAQLFEPNAGGETKLTTVPGNGSNAGAGRKKPAILFIHGGPSRQMLLGWHYGDYYSNTYSLNQYLANLGFVVLSVNYRLGIGYGYEFQHPVKGGYFGASEYLDVKAAGDWLAKQPNIDRSRIGVYGGSYGGYLTALAIGRDSKLFAAGVDIHGVHNHLNFAPPVDGEQPPDAVLARKLLWESSPVSWVDGMRSPMLFIHGDDDANVDFEESTDLIRRFQQQGKSYESLVIPDETHHWMRYENMLKIDKATAEFLSRKLKP